jgi:hypothetical protein
MIPEIAVVGSDMAKQQQLMTLGWREWVSLPDLGLPHIKAKVDTGARTSAIHAFALNTYEKDGQERVEFRMHPNQKDTETVVVCDAAVIDKRVVTDSGGHKEERLVIETTLQIGRHSWSVEATLTARDNMLFRMLIGRTAMKGRAVVDPARSYVVGSPPEAA